MIAVARFIAFMILLSFLSQLTPALARASSFEDKTWDAGNVSVLPPEVHKRLTRMCGPDLVAEPYFAGYFANSKFSFCILGVFAAVARPASVPKVDACIRFTEEKVASIVC